ncbi:MAG: phenylacetate-CoA oxygenase subunit PaaC [Saprospiraceae bacterium]|nr:phenylacetate-CoA oxygenase subunit PaaC [Saprospiraceae bacterium]
MKEQLYQYLLLLGDNTMILGHRLSELCGHGPSLETDIALTNISLDLFGQVRNYFQYAAEVKQEIGENTATAITEDSIAFTRYPHEYRNTLLVEQPNKDFAFVMTRQFFFDAYHLPLLEALLQSKDEQIAAIAHKSIKEVKYHLRFSSEWVKRLGDGTSESHDRMQTAVDHLYPYIGELVQETPIEKSMKEQGIGADLSIIRSHYYDRIKSVLKEATLSTPQFFGFHDGGKKGVHSEHHSHILSTLQYMQRTYPNMEW